MAKINVKKGAKKVASGAKKVGGAIGRSVLIKLTLTVMVTIALLNVANVLNYTRLIRNTMCGYFMDNIDEDTKAVFVTERRMVAVISKQLTQDFKLNRSAVTAFAQGETSAIAGLLHDFVQTFELPGYVLTDNEGLIVSSSFPESYSETQAYNLGKFVKYVSTKPEKSYIGSVDLLDRGPCIVGTVAVRDSAHHAVGYAIISSASLIDSDFLRRCADYSGVCLSVLRDSICVASSIPPSDYFSMVGSTLSTPWVLDSLAAGNQVVHEHAEVFGQEYFSSFTAIKDYSGKTVAVLHASQDDQELASFVLFSRLCGISNGILWGFIALAVCIITLRHFLLKPIKLMRDAAIAIANGDLSSNLRIVDTDHDEVQQLGESILTIQTSLRGTIASLANTSKMLHSSSEELSRSSLQLSDAANKQAAALEEISSSLEEMTGNIHQNTDNAMVTDKLMMDADKSVSSIADAATDSMVNTRKIAGSIRAINLLVNKTNILSLNASVEAARAGSSGRGFAVVAREVGRLAEQTKRTASGVSDTAALSIAGAENINTLLDNVTPHLHKVVDLIKEIAASSQEQGIGADQINIAIGSLNKVTQETAANAEEIAANAQELASSADKMKQQIYKFKF